MCMHVGVGMYVSMYVFVRADQQRAARTSRSSKCARHGDHYAPVVVRRAAPVSTRGELGLNDKTGVSLAVATVREIVSPRSPNLHSVVYSQSRGCTTVKYHGVCVGNGFLVELSRGYGGSTSNSKIVEVDGVGKRLAGDHGLPVVLLYDKVCV